MVIFDNHAETEICKLKIAQLNNYLLFYYLSANNKTLFRRTVICQTIQNKNN